MAMDKVTMKDDQLDRVTGGTVIPYTVQPGDSLTAIAKKFHVSEETLRAWNNLPEGHMLGVGQILKVKF